jgi:hypothetical protein
MNDPVPLTAAEAQVREHVRHMAAASAVQLDSYLDEFGRFFTPAPLPPVGGQRGA